MRTGHAPCPRQRLLLLALMLLGGTAAAANGAAASLQDEPRPYWSDA